MSTCRGGEVGGAGGYGQGTPSYVIHHLMRDGTVVLEKVVVARLGGSSYLLYHRLLRNGMSVLASSRGGGSILA